MHSETDTRLSCLEVSTLPMTMQSTTEKNTTTSFEDRLNGKLEGYPVFKPGYSPSFHPPRRSGGSNHTTNII